MKQPRYREAIEWLAYNDDCYWLADHEPVLSVSASLVRDLWDRDETKLIGDIKRALAKAYPDHIALQVG